MKRGRYGATEYQRSRVVTAVSVWCWLLGTLMVDMSNFMEIRNDYDTRFARNEISARTLYAALAPCQHLRIMGAT